MPPAVFRQRSWNLQGLLHSTPGSPNNNSSHLQNSNEHNGTTGTNSNGPHGNNSGNLRGSLGVISSQHRGSLGRKSLRSDEETSSNINGVNLFGQKNYIGTFAPPFAVLMPAAPQRLLIPAAVRRKAEERQPVDVGSTGQRVEAALRR